MSLICCSENNNSFVVEDWTTVGVSSQGVFTSAVPIQRAPKKLVTFAWSHAFSIQNEEPDTPAQEYRAAIESLFEHSMSEEEVAFLRREMASDFAPLTTTQTRLLPPRLK